MHADAGVISAPGFSIRVMRRDEVEVIRAWATAEGWNPGLHDGPCFFDTDPEGFVTVPPNAEDLAIR